MPRTIIDIPFETAEKYPDRVSHKTKTKTGEVTHTYREFAAEIRQAAAGLSVYGVKPEDKVGFFVNNRYEWSVLDFAQIAAGAVSVPRGSDTSPLEVQFIFQHSDSSFLIVEEVKQLHSLLEVFSRENWKACTRIFIVDEAPVDDLPKGVRKKTVFYKDLVEAGREKLERAASERAAGDIRKRAAGDNTEGGDWFEQMRGRIGLDDLMTIVYTSGTTGNPKGVMLTQGNFIQNVEANTPRLGIDPEKGEKTVVMLPSWHVYERTFEYCGLLSGIQIIYSAAKRFAADLQEEKPEIIISVPRVWESIYQKLIKALSTMPAPKRLLIFSFIKINQVFLLAKNYLKGGYISLKKRGPLRKALAFLGSSFLLVVMFPGHILATKMFTPFREKVGGNLRGATSGAGALPKYLDELFNSLGITILNAYGMTECAPGILSRTFECNTFGSTGRPFINTEVKVLREDGSPAEVGEKGVLYVRGPQVMRGYYKNPKATEEILDKDGWLNTGDLAIYSENGEIIIAGRAKDTIVLMGGENVEPEHIEDKIKESAYIDHAVLLGQDRKQLTALVAVNPDELMKLAEELKVTDYEVPVEGANSIENDKINAILMREVNSLISKDQGFKPFEAISKIMPVRNDFTIGRELTQTLKVKRQYIQEKYKNLIDKLNGDIRSRGKGGSKEKKDN
ncbi:MAG: AMP-dependent synthetase/ligase [Spirochaetaceae bacterium]